MKNKPKEPTRKAALVPLMVWERVCDLQPRPAIAAMADAYSAEAAQCRKAYKEAEKARKARRTRAAAQTLAAAAAAVVVFGMGSLVSTVQQPSSVAPQQEAGQVIASTAGEWKRIVLADGSTVVLDEHTRIIATIGDKRRHIAVVTGRVHFKVKKDKRPFIATIGDREAVALGTEFGVINRPAMRSVALVEGRVCVRPVGTTTLCEPGNRQSGILMTSGDYLSIGPQGGRPRKTNLSSERLWAEGIQFFSATPVSRIVEEVNRYSKRKILLSEDVEKQARTSAHVKIGDVNALAAKLQKSGVAQVVSENKRTILLAAPVE